MNYLDNLDKKKQQQTEAKRQNDSLVAFDTLSKEVRSLLDSLEKTGAKKLDKEVVKSIKSLEKVASTLSSIKVTSDQDIKKGLKSLERVMKSLDTRPVVNVKAPVVEVNEREIDFTPLTDLLKKLEVKAPEVHLDTSDLSEKMEKVHKAITSLSFPTANYILPFKDPTTGKATQVTLNSDGTMPVDFDTTGLATSAKQDTGNTSLASIDGKITTVNTGAVVVSSSALPTGASTAAKQPALGTAGTASADVLTVQGIASMTALKTDGSATTQPVSAASLPLPTGASTSANQTNGSQLTQIVDAGGDAVTVTGGKLDVNATISGSGGGTSAIDDAAFAAATDSGTPMMGFVTADSVDSGDVGVVGMTADRSLKVQAQANSGVDIGDVTINNATIAVTQSGTWDEVGINDSGNSITVDQPTGTNLHTVVDSGSITANAGTNLNTSALALSATQTDGTQKTRITDGTTDNIMLADNTDATGASATVNKTAVVNRNTIWGSSAAAWHRQRAVENSTDSTGTGITATGMLAQFDDTTPSTVTENRFANVRMSSRRELYGQIRDAAGNERGLNIGASGDASVTVVSALPAGTNAVGKLAANSGVDIGDVDVTSVIPGTGATNLGKAEDAGHTTGDTGVAVWAVRNDLLATTFTNSDGDYSPIAVTSTGRVYGSVIVDSALPAGTNAIGKLAANSGVDIGDVDVTSAVTGTIDHGSNQDIDTAAEQITSTSFACKFGVTLRAPSDNTSTLWIGNSDVTVGGTAATDGIPLYPGDSLFLPVSNSNIPYAIASAVNQKIYWIAA